MPNLRQSASGLSYLELRPESPGAKTGLVVGLHGRGANADDLASMAGWLHPESYNFALPNAPLPVEGTTWDGHAWYSLGEHQATEIGQSAKQLFAFLLELEQSYEIPRESTVLMGFSQGAVMALEVGLRSKAAFAGLVAMSGYLHAPERVVQGAHSVRGRRVFMVHGTYDEVISVEAARRAREVLLAAGVELEYLELPIEHQVSPNSLAQVRSFLEQVLPVAL